jgi:alkanesulfonate monooxygenase SsuD/methylene tetrahydromethanopterin reductase-like flavin-dependent oxidoreductase (luciferase family)
VAKDLHLGLMMECEYRPGATDEGAFDEAFDLATFAEDLGYDAIWLAERHFSSPGASPRARVAACRPSLRRH